MDDKGVCYGLLIAISVLIGALVRNGFLLNLLVKRLTTLIVAGLRDDLGWQCKYPNHGENRNAPQNPNTNPGNRSSNPAGNLRDTKDNA